MGSSSAYVTRQLGGVNVNGIWRHFEPEMTLLTNAKRIATVCVCRKRIVVFNGYWQWPVKPIMCMYVCNAMWQLYSWRSVM